MNFQKNNEKITNLIHHEYIKGSFLIGDTWKHIFIYLLYEKLDCQTYHYSNRLLVTINFVKIHAWSYFYLFIHITYTILYQWSNDIQHVYCLVNTHKSLFKIFYSFYMTNKCQMWISKIMLFASILFDQKWVEKKIKENITSFLFGWLIF
jgi:hypothetical protein